MEFFAHKRNYQDIMSITTAVSKWVSVKFRAAMEISGVEMDIVMDKFDELRAAMARMSVIKRTNFIPSGYHLMCVLVCFTVFLVTLARYDNGAPEVPSGGGGRRLLGEDINMDTMDDWISSNLSPYIVRCACALRLSAPSSPPSHCNPSP